jgi:hypothetical protein
MKTEQAVEQICFGLNRETDQRSLVLFLQLFSRNELLAALVPRLEEEEIHHLVETCTALLARHLTEQEYHALVLGEED